MLTIPDTEKKLRSRISSYRSALNKEKKIHGSISDGSGKRYVLFLLYFVLNDLKKSEEYFEWYKKEAPNDSGEPIQKLCWALGLHRMEKEEEAKQKLADLMLSNLYMIPKTIGRSIQPYDIWHPSNLTDIDYGEDILEELIEKIEESEIQWMSSLYDSPEFSRIRKRYIEIYEKIQNIREYEERHKLLSEARSLIDTLAVK